MTQTTTCRWGIISTGWISQRFAVDLLIDPATRDTHDVKHEIVAVASRSTDRVDSFLDRCWQEAKSKAPRDKIAKYDNYQQLYDDANVQAVYIGTPHSHHFQNVHRALQAGKNVLCEKPITANADQAKTLFDLARQKGVFLMEAVWTRFTPFAYKLQEVIQSGKIGTVTRVQADLSVLLDRKEMGDDHRMFNPDLAGGALLDLGPYPWTILALSLLHHPRRESSTATIPLPRVVSSMILNDLGTDDDTSATITFDGPASKVHGILTTGLRTSRDYDRSVATISGTQGYIQVAFPAYRPEGLSYASWTSPKRFSDNPQEPDDSDSFDFTQRPGRIWGFAWEADEVARCVRDGKKESERMPPDETVLMMSVFDEIRRQNGMTFPEHVESTQLWADELQH